MVLLKYDLKIRPMRGFLGLRAGQTVWKPYFCRLKTDMTHETILESVRF